MRRRLAEEGGAAVTSACGPPQWCALPRVRSNLEGILLFLLLPAGGERGGSGPPPQPPRPGDIEITPTLLLLLLPACRTQGVIEDPHVSLSLSILLLLCVIRPESGREGPPGACAGACLAPVALAAFAAFAALAALAAVGVCPGGAAQAPADVGGAG